MSSGSPLADEHYLPRCRHCDEVIGVYEPLILVSQGARRETSVVAEPNLFATDAAYYHRACYPSGSADAPG